MHKTIMPANPYQPKFSRNWRQLPKRCHKFRSGVNRKPIQIKMIGGYVNKTYPYPVDPYQKQSIAV